MVIGENAARVLELSLGRDAFSRSLLPDLRPGGLFVPTEEYFSLAEPLTLRMDLEDLPGVTEVTGTVAWHRRPRTWRSNLPPGIGFLFDPQHVELVSFLTEFCKGRVGDRRRSGLRTNAEFPVRFLVDGSWMAGKAQNISSGGMFVLASDQVDLGTTVRMKLFMDGLPGPADCSGQPTWVVRSDGVTGFGARFSSVSPSLKRRLSINPLRQTGAFEPVKDSRSTLTFGKSR